MFAHCFHKAPVVRMHLASCTSAGYALLPPPPYLSTRSIFAGFSENFSILYGRVLVVIVGSVVHLIGVCAHSFQRLIVLYPHDIRSYGPKCYFFVAIID